MASKGIEENHATSSISNKKPPELKDLDDSVLIMIFKRLSINDLVNIVEYDNDLKTAALSAFKENFGKYAVTVTNIFNPLKQESSKSAKLLNCFGNHIAKLIVEYLDGYREVSKVIDDTIISRCCKTLEEIEFQRAGRFTMYGICKPFENVHTVGFIHGDICPIVSQFGKWFPQARVLKLNWQKFGEYCDTSNMENNPSLQHLEIRKKKCDNSTAYLRSFIKRSPELKHLRIEYGDGEMNLDDTLINTNLPNLESLHLQFRNSTYIANHDREKVRFGKLKNLTIESKKSHMASFTIATDSLQTLKFYASEGFGKGLVEFFENNSNVEFVELLGSHIAATDAVISSLAKLSNLKEIQFPFPYFYNEAPQLNQVDLILKDCKFLRKLTIIAKNVNREKIPLVESSMNTFAASVDGQWDSAVSKEVIPDFGTTYRINFQLIVQKNHTDTQTSRMELRMKRKYPTSNKSKTTYKRRRTEIKQLELKDLNDDCLIMIFKLLTIDDLVNMVEYNNHFKTAALITFKHKYGNDNINVSVEYNSITKEPLWCIRLLKYFGSEITKLSIKYYNEDSRQINDSIDDAVVKYCHKSLLELAIINGKGSTMHRIRKPFENVRTVSFDGGFVSETVYNFGKWFPKANTLKFKNIHEPKDVRKIQIKNAPALEHFEIRFGTLLENVYDYLSPKIIESNPQLKSLYSKYDLYTYRRDTYSYDYYDEVGLSVDHTFVNLAMPNLENLHLALPNEKSLTESKTSYSENGKWHFAKLKNLHIEFEGSGILKCLPISTNNLETLILTGIDNIKGRHCANFIRDNQNVKSVKITGNMMDGLCSDIHVLCEAVLPLPNLTELEIPYDNYFGFLPVSFPIVDLLERTNLLRKLVVNCGSKENVEKIQQLFNNADDAIKGQWKISKDMADRNRCSLTFEKSNL